ncbi:MAG: glycosyltransferase [Bacteroidetes bacterium]|nr:glycosyltransferase [Bacteroidota bacterium]
MPTSQGKSSVLFITSWYTKKDNPSLGIYVKRHAIALSKFEKCTILHAYNSTENRTEEHTINPNLSEIIVYYKKSDFRLFDIVRYIKAYRKGLDVVKKSIGTPSLIQANITFPVGIIAYLFKITHKIPYVIQEHWSGYLQEDGSYKISNSILKFFHRLIIKNANSVATVSHALQKAMLDNNLKNRNYTRVPNVIDTKLFSPSYPAETRNKQIIHISSLNDIEKNITTLIETIAELKTERDDFTCIFCGTSSEENKFKELATKKNILNTVVFFKGFLKPEELVIEIRKSAFLLMYSNYETFSCVTLEAMACGIPVLSGDAGGVKELITEETGIVVPQNNNQALKKKINFMLDNYAKYDSSVLHEYVQTNFSEDVVGKQIQHWHKQSLK